MMQDLPPALLSLSDSEMTALMQASRPIRPEMRDAFLEAVATELGRYLEVGPGLVHRIARETQRRFFDPPDLTGHNSRWDG
jgi:hypothetical protein